MLKRRPIETFHPPKWGDKQTLRRWEYTKNFIERHLCLDNAKVLDSGDENPFGQKLAEYFGLRYHHTNGDLDYNWSTECDGLCDVVFCFEILEHLINPGSYLVGLKQYIKRDAQIFVSVPRTPRFLWIETHFHEFDTKRFEYLMKRAGYQIVDHEVHTLWKPLRLYFTGIRPLLLRWNIGRNRTHWYYIRMAE